MDNNVVHFSEKPIKTSSTREDWIEGILSLGRPGAPDLPLEKLLEVGRELAWDQAIKIAGADDEAVEVWDEAEQEWLIDVTSIGDPEIREAVVCRIDIFLQDFRQFVERQNGGKS